MTLKPGSGRFGLAIPEGHAVGELPVWYHLPEDLPPDRRIVMVLHGTSRAAEASRDNWRRPAEDNRFVVVVPHFEMRHFSDAAYAYGNFWSPEPPYTAAAWERSYGAILDRLFEAVNAALGWNAPAFTLYGHSAGAAFAHRYLALAPEDRVEQAVLANAGWYSLLEPGTPIPLGFEGCYLPAARLPSLLAKDVTILVGDRDTVGPYPDWWPECHGEQGPHRFARSLTFFRSAEDLARRLAVPFHWRWESVPGVGHENAKMIAPAVRLLARRRAITL